MKYEDHEKLSKWLQNFFDDAQQCFNILKAEYGDKKPLVKHAAKAINSMANIRLHLKDDSDMDRVREGVSITNDDECKKWRKLYEQIVIFRTEGYYK